MHLAVLVEAHSTDDGEVVGEDMWCGNWEVIDTKSCHVEGELLGGRKVSRLVNDVWRV
jgi:hypothetical protein